MTRTRCSLPDRWMRLWPEPPDHINHLRVEPPFGLPGVEVKHLRQGERLKVNILGFQDVLLRLEPKKIEVLSRCRLEITNLKQNFLLETTCKIDRQRATRSSCPNNYQRISCSFPTCLDAIDTFMQSSYNWRFLSVKSILRNKKNKISRLFLTFFTLKSLSSLCQCFEMS